MIRTLMYFLVALLLSSRCSYSTDSVTNLGWTTDGGSAALKCITTPKKSVEFTYKFDIIGPEIVGGLLNTNAYFPAHDYIYFEGDYNATNLTAGLQRTVVSKIVHTFEADGIFNVTYYIRGGAVFADNESGAITFDYEIVTREGTFDPVNITGDSCYIGPIDDDDDEPSDDDESSAASIKQITGTLWLVAAAGLCFFWS